MVHQRKGGIHAIYR